jgi:hypothetical protein
MRAKAPSLNQNLLHPIHPHKICLPLCTCWNSSPIVVRTHSRRVLEETRNLFLPRKALKEIKPRVEFIGHEFYEATAARATKMCIPTRAHPHSMPMKRQDYEGISYYFEETTSKDSQIPIANWSPSHSSEHQAGQMVHRHPKQAAQ